MTVNNEIIPSKVSSLVPTQFPLWFREKGPQFIAFVQAYYEWMEQAGNPLYYSRRYYEIKDVDRTLDEFIIHFKEKYLKNIQLTTKSDTRLLIKHALDIYRSKGTERCVQLLFQLVYNEPTRFYYPSQDLFKLSDGSWRFPYYLELTLADSNVNLVHKSVRGSNSGATAFIEDVVRRRTNGTLQDVAYISALKGNFVTDEKIVPNDGSISINDCPYMKGSLTTIEISPPGAGINYSVGDIIDFSSTYGTGGKARVANTTNQFGLVSFSLDDGGYGFTTDANVHISNIALNVANLTTSNIALFSYFRFGNTITQPLSTISYISANGNLSEGDAITTYYGNNSVMGTGRILEEVQTNSTAGSLLVSLVTGSLNNTFYTTANAVKANVAVAGYASVNATGKFIANLNSVILTVSNTSNFSISEKIYQGSTHGILAGTLGSNLYIDSIYGTFKSGILVYGSNTGATSNVTSIGLSLGLIDISNTFTAADGNYFWANTENNYISGTITRLDEAGSGLSVSLSNTFLLTETIHDPNQSLDNYTALALNAATYGFPGNPSANASVGALHTWFTNTDITIGKLSDIILHGFGQDYTIAPFIVIDEERISNHQFHDPILTITGGVSFTNGEVITQEASGARGTVLSDSNSSILYLQSNRYYRSNSFINTTNSTTIIMGSQSGLSANVANVTSNVHSAVMGRNAVLESSFIEANGTITELSVTVSGYGFQEGELIDIISQNSANDVPGIGIVHLGKQGKGGGYYRQKGGYLSDQKKLFDGDFYQNYSYEVISNLMLSKYKDMLFAISHPAGTKLFGRLAHATSTNTALSIDKSVINIT